MHRRTIQDEKAETARLRLGTPKTNLYNLHLGLTCRWDPLPVKRGQSSDEYYRQALLEDARGETSMIREWADERGWQWVVPEWRLGLQTLARGMHIRGMHIRGMHIRGMHIRGMRTRGI